MVTNIPIQWIGHSFLFKKIFLSTAKTNLISLNFATEGKLNEYS